jgi:hypothetical protein
MRVRAGSLYRYSPTFWDMHFPCTNNTLKPGQIVKVTTLPGAPSPNTMGQCYVADPQTGRFICMVSTSSLVRVRL